jgi:GWxTD domain-containing protein
MEAVMLIQQGTAGRCVALVVTISLLVTTAVFSEEKNDGPYFEYDMVAFASDLPELSRLDVFVRLQHNELQFIKAETQFQAQYEVAVEVRKEDEIVDAGVQTGSLVVDSISETGNVNQYTIEKLTLELVPAKYTVSVAVEDMETQKSRRFEHEIEVRDFSRPVLSISDVLFSEGFTQDGQSTMLQPRISDVQFEASRLYGYYEVYHLAANDSFLVRYEIKDSDNKSLASDQYWSKGVDGLGKEIVPLIQKNDLPHGQYSVIIQIEQGKNKAQSESTFNWFLAGLPRQFKSIDEAIEVLKYLASKQEMKKMQKAPKTERHTELLRFWKGHDPSPETAENELQQEYYNRVLYANDAFKTYQKEGWKTDMGWVFILLGPADQVERVPFNNSYAGEFGRTVKAAQVWMYYQFNRDFVFLDENGFGDYRLNNPETLYEIVR